MSAIRESARDIPVVRDVDVAVVGGSCTGVFAAVRAARLGLSVAIIEKQNCFGGAATAGLVNVWHSLYDTQGEKQIIGGLTAEVIERLGKRGAVSESGNPLVAYRLNTEELKIDLDELVDEHNIEPMLHTFYVAPVLEDDRIDAVIVENKNGRQAIRAQYFVDASGDADLALHAGLPARETGSFQPPTTCAKFAHMDSLGDFDWVGAIRDHGKEFGLTDDWGWHGPIPGTSVTFHADTHVFGADTADGDQLTRAEITGRKRLRAVMDCIRKYGPAEARIALVDLAATIGVRETRRVEARYQLTGEDVLHGRRFDDAIANGSYPVDIHHADGPGITFRFLDGTEKVYPGHGQEGRHGRWRDPLPEDPTFYQIPFRCMTSERVRNLVLAGRMIDTDKVAFSAVRVMVNLNQTGEAAGVACALAAENGQSVADIDPGHLRDTLAAGGSIIL